MPIAHYRLSAAFAASLSLALAGCGSSPPTQQAAAGQPGALQPGTNGQQAASKDPDEMDTDATIWTVLGLAKEPSYHEPGPKTGSTVSPILWQAAHDTLGFVKFVSEDPLTGAIVTDWYSPQGQPDLRYKIDVFILSRALRSDSVVVTVQRQQRSATGQWVETTIARSVDEDLETKILDRARQLKRAWMAAAAAS